MQIAARYNGRKNGLRGWRIKEDARNLIPKTHLCLLLVPWLCQLNHDWYQESIIRPFQSRESKYEKGYHPPRWTNWLLLSSPSPISVLRTHPPKIATLRSRSPARHLIILLEELKKQELFKKGKHVPFLGWTVRTQSVRFINWPIHCALTWGNS